VKATFFLVGSMANEAPVLVKRNHAEGHAIGTHTQHHQWLTRLPREAVKKEITEGIASVAAATPKPSRPFFGSRTSTITKRLKKSSSRRGW
jgi:peptidoglycan/xylan/chitin deacetylase (PgdA/CDA1 family)